VGELLRTASFDVVEAEEGALLREGAADKVGFGVLHCEYIMRMSGLFAPANL
jgi:hypothetical protein